MKHLKLEPAMVVYMANAAVALLVAYGLPLSDGQVGAVTVIATALTTIYTAVATRPVVVSAITGAVGTGLAAATAFGLHLTDNQIGTTVTAISIGLALLLRQNVTPAATVARFNAAMESGPRL